MTSNISAEHEQLANSRINLVLTAMRKIHQTVHETPIDFSSVAQIVFQDYLQLSLIVNTMHARSPLWWAADQVQFPVLDLARFSEDWSGGLYGFQMQTLAQRFEALPKRFVYTLVVYHESAKLTTSHCIGMRESRDTCDIGEAFSSLDVPEHTDRLYWIDQEGMQCVAQQIAVAEQPNQNVGTSLVWKRIE